MVRGRPDHDAIHERVEPNAFGRQPATEIRRHLPLLAKTVQHGSKDVGISLDQLAGAMRWWQLTQACRPLPMIWGSFDGSAS
jgi:hypothetical protein